MVSPPYYARYAAATAFIVTVATYRLLAAADFRRQPLYYAVDAIFHEDADAIFHAVIMLCWYAYDAFMPSPLRHYASCQPSPLIFMLTR